MSEPDNRPRRNSYRIRSARAWTLIRERYLAGESAPRLAEVFDVTEAAIRARSTRQGWSKRSLAEATPVEPADAALADLAAAALVGQMEPRAAARLALGEAVRLLRTGKLGLAAEAARVADLVGRAADRLGEAAEEPGDDEAAFEAVRRKVLGIVDGAAPSTASRSPSPQGGEETG